jgi:tRNA (adenine22-N1)-methyltransferase
MCNLNKRLSAIAELVREGAKVCDVGTDHAYLPCYLAKRGKNSEIYACDINEKPLTRAKSEIKRQGVFVTLIRSNGLEKVPPCEDVIIAGMGGELIAEIAEKCPFKNTNLHLITQPMTRHEDLRRRLYKSGYAIVSEKTVRENGRIFIIILAEYTGKSIEIDDVAAYIGTPDASCGDSGYIKSRIDLLIKKGKGDKYYLELAEELRRAKAAAPFHPPSL